MTKAQAELVMALREERDLLVTRIFKDFAECEGLLRRAFDERLSGNIPEARILLNEALDAEYAATGDCQVLGPLAEEWEVVHERDQRHPAPEPKPMKCPTCPANMERADYTHVTTVGDLTVTHETTVAWTCHACGRSSLSSAELFGYEREAALRLLRLPGPVSGEVLKFARKVLGLRRPEMEERLGFAEGQLAVLEALPLLAPHLRLAMITLIEGTALPAGSNCPTDP